MQILWKCGENFEPSLNCSLEQCLSVMILDSCVETGNVDGINFAGYHGTTDTDSYVGYKKSVIKTLLSTRLASPIHSHVPSTYVSVLTVHVAVK
jgi:hypothetical protein